MRNILYWSFLILVAILLAYVSPFGLYHLVFLLGAGALVLAYYSILPRQQRRVAAASVFVYVAIYWTTVGLFSNVNAQREFLARHEPDVDQGIAEGFTFYYLDHPGAY